MPKTRYYDEEERRAEKARLSEEVEDFAFPDAGASVSRMTATSRRVSNMALVAVHSDKRVERWEFDEVLTGVGVPEDRLAGWWRRYRQLIWQYNPRQSGYVSPPPREEEPDWD